MYKAETTGNSNCEKQLSMILRSWILSKELREKGPHVAGVQRTRCSSVHSSFWIFDVVNMTTYFERNV
jgi:hypothetical protein